MNIETRTASNKIKDGLLEIFLGLIAILGCVAMAIITLGAMIVAIVIPCLPVAILVLGCVWIIRFIWGAM